LVPHAHGPQVSLKVANLLLRQNISQRGRWASDRRRAFWAWLRLWFRRFARQQRAVNLH
jgi:hypothetical protein